MYTFGYHCVNQLNFGKRVSIIKIESGTKNKIVGQNCPIIIKEVKNNVMS